MTFLFPFSSCLLTHPNVFETKPLATSSPVAWNICFAFTHDGLFMTHATFWANLQVEMVSHRSFSSKDNNAIIAALQFPPGTKKSNKASKRHLMVWFLPLPLPPPPKKNWLTQNKNMQKEKKYPISDFNQLISTKNCSQKHENAILGTPGLKFSRGSMPPDFPWNLAPSALAMFPPPNKFNPTTALLIGWVFRLSKEHCTLWFLNKLYKYIYMIICLLLQRTKLLSCPFRHSN